MCSAVVTPPAKRTSFQLRTLTCKGLHHREGYFLWAKILAEEVLQLTLKNNSSEKGRYQRLWVFKIPVIFLTLAQ